MLRERIYEKLSTAMEYIEHHQHIKETEFLISSTKEKINEAVMDFLARGFVIKGLVHKINEAGKTPHIIELAPGSYWLPIGLKKNGLKFKYHGPSLNKEHERLAANYLIEEVRAGSSILPEDPTIFTCFELIEHLHQPDEIAHHYYKYQTKFDHILISTPKYCYGGGNPQWPDTDLGHLRTYTPKEFFQFALKLWPTHKWTLYDNETMILHGEKL
jgi:hypothetical protein